MKKTICMLLAVILTLSCMPARAASGYSDAIRASSTT